MQTAAMDFRIFAGGDNGVVKDRTLRGFGQSFQEREVAFNFALRLGDLNEAVPAAAQHFGKVQNVIVTHGVGHHR